MADASQSSVQACDLPSDLPMVWITQGKTDHAAYILKIESDGRRLVKWVASELTQWVTADAVVKTELPKRRRRRAPGQDDFVFSTIGSSARKEKPSQAATVPAQSKKRPRKPKEEAAGADSSNHGKKPKEVPRQPQQPQQQQQPKTNNTDVGDKKYPIGTKVYKEFPPFGWFAGTVVGHTQRWWYQVQYEDDDSEEMTEKELDKIVVRDDDEESAQQTAGEATSSSEALTEDAPPKANKRPSALRPKITILPRRDSSLSAEPLPSPTQGIVNNMSSSDESDDEELETPIALMAKNSKKRSLHAEDKEPSRETKKSRQDVDQESNKETSRITAAANNTGGEEETQNKQNEKALSNNSQPDSRTPAANPNTPAIQKRLSSMGSAVSSLIKRVFTPSSADSKESSPAAASNPHTAKPTNDEEMDPSKKEQGTVCKTELEQGERDPKQPQPSAVESKPNVVGIIEENQEPSDVLQSTLLKSGTVENEEEFTKSSATGDEKDSKARSQGDLEVGNPGLVAESKGGADVLQSAKSKTVTVEDTEKKESPKSTVNGQLQDCKVGGHCKLEIGKPGVAERKRDMQNQHAGEEKEKVERQNGNTIEKPADNRQASTGIVDEKKIEEPKAKSKQVIIQVLQGTGSDGGKALAKPLWTNQGGAEKGAKSDSHLLSTDEESATRLQVTKKNHLKQGDQGEAGEEPCPEIVDDKDGANASEKSCPEALQAASEEKPVVCADNSSMKALSKKVLEFKKTQSPEQKPETAGEEKMEQYPLRIALDGAGTETGRGCPSGAGTMRIPTDAKPPTTQLKCTGPLETADTGRAGGKNGKKKEKNGFGTRRKDIDCQREATGVEGQATKEQEEAERDKELSLQTGSSESGEGSTEALSQAADAALHNTNWTNGDTTKPAESISREKSLSNEKASSNSREQQTAAETSVMIAKDEVQPKPSETSVAKEYAPSPDIATAVEGDEYSEIAVQTSAVFKSTVASLPREQTPKPDSEALVREDANGSALTQQSVSGAEATAKPRVVNAPSEETCRAAGNASASPKPSDAQRSTEKAVKPKVSIVKALKPNALYAGIDAKPAKDPAKPALSGQAAKPNDESELAVTNPPKEPFSKSVPKGAIKPVTCTGHRDTTLNPTATTVSDELAKTSVSALSESSAAELPKDRRGLVAHATVEDTSTTSVPPVATLLKDPSAVASRIPTEPAVPSTHSGSKAMPTVVATEPVVAAAPAKQSVSSAKPPAVAAAHATCSASRRKPKPIANTEEPVVAATPSTCNIAKPSDVAAEPEVAAMRATRSAPKAKLPAVSTVLVVPAAHATHSIPKVQPPAAAAEPVAAAAAPVTRNKAKPPAVPAEPEVAAAPTTRIFSKAKLPAAAAEPLAAAAALVTRNKAKSPAVAAKPEVAVVPATRSISTAKLPAAAAEPVAAAAAPVTRNKTKPPAVAAEPEVAAAPTTRTISKAKLPATAAEPVAAAAALVTRKKAKPPAVAAKPEVAVEPSTGSISQAKPRAIAAEPVAAAAAPVARNKAKPPAVAAEPEVPAVPSTGSISKAKPGAVAAEPVVAEAKPPAVTAQSKKRAPPPPADKIVRKSRRIALKKDKKDKEAEEEGAQNIGTKKKPSNNKKVVIKDVSLPTEDKEKEQKEESEKPREPHSSDRHDSEPNSSNPQGSEPNNSEEESMDEESSVSSSTGSESSVSNGDAAEVVVDLNGAIVDQSPPDHIEVHSSDDDEEPPHEGALDRMDLAAALLSMQVLPSGDKLASKDIGETCRETKDVLVTLPPSGGYKYHPPETCCPVCGQHIEALDKSPVDWERPLRYATNKNAIDAILEHTAKFHSDTPVWNVLEATHKLEFEKGTNVPVTPVAFVKLALRNAVCSSYSIDENLLDMTKLRDMFIRRLGIARGFIRWSSDSYLQGHKFVNCGGEPVTNAELRRSSLMLLAYLEEHVLEHAFEKYFHLTEELAHSMPFLRWRNAVQCVFLDPSGVENAWFMKDEKEIRTAH